MKPPLTPALRRNIPFPEIAAPYLTGDWIDDETLMMPAFCVSPDERYAHFLTFHFQPEEWPGMDYHPWSLYFEDLFVGGGADGDSESFPTLYEAILRACEIIESWKDDAILCR